MRDPEELKEIKVKLPVRQHIKLHSIKLMMNQNISTTVEHALESYFELLKEEQATEKDLDDIVDEAVVGQPGE